MLCLGSLNKKAERRALSSKQEMTARQDGRTGLSCPLSLSAVTPANSYPTSISISDPRQLYRCKSEVAVICRAVSLDSECLPRDIWTSGKRLYSPCCFCCKHVHHQMNQHVCALSPSDRRKTRVSQLPTTPRALN